jgi:hypothetical protein
MFYPSEQRTARDVRPCQRPYGNRFRQKIPLLLERARAASCSLATLAMSCNDKTVAAPNTGPAAADDKTFIHWRRTIRHAPAAWTFVRRRW